MVTKPRNRGKYYVVWANGDVESFDSKSELVRGLESGGIDDAIGVFRGHKLEIETKQIDRITIK